jgi:E3 ubiquitin-protein ligase HUWE1
VLDELIHHYLLLRTAVLDALKATIAKIEELGTAYEVPGDLRHWYHLVPVSVPPANDGNVPMEDVENVAAASSLRSNVNAQGEDM